MTYTKRERFCVDGVEVLRCNILLPYPEALPEISDFYFELGEKSYSYAKNSLFSVAGGEYNSDSDERKKFYFKGFRYALDSKITLENENLLSVRLFASLTRNGSREPISSFCAGHVWDKKKQMLLPPRRALKDIGYKGGCPKKVKSVLLYEDGISVLCNGAWEKF